jgi:hypothetical protein
MFLCYHGFENASILARVIDDPLKSVISSWLGKMSNENVPDYFDIFQRNIGIFTRDEQLYLKNSIVLIAGVGGVGGP